MRVQVVLSAKYEENVFDFAALLKEREKSEEGQSATRVDDSGQPGRVDDSEADVVMRDESAAESDDSPEAESDGQATETGIDDTDNPTSSQMPQIPPPTPFNLLNSQNDPAAPNLITEPEKAKRGRPKADPEDDYYDLDDPFIDDSDFKQFELTGVYKPLETGFFVWRGPVEHIPVAKTENDEDQTSKRKRPSTIRRYRKAAPDNSDKEDFETSGPSAQSGGLPGEKIGDAEPSGPARKRKRVALKEAAPAGQVSVPPAIQAPRSPRAFARQVSAPRDPPNSSSVVAPEGKTFADAMSASANALKGDPASLQKERKFVHLPDEIQEVFDELVTEASKEHFEDKKHFPEHLQTIVSRMSHILDSVNADESTLEVVARHMSKVMPYNKLTMKNLVNRSLLPSKIERLKSLIPGKYETLQSRIDFEIARGNGTTDPKVLERTSEGGSENVDGVQVVKKFVWTKDVRLALWDVIQTETDLGEAQEASDLLHRRVPSRDDGRLRKEIYLRVQKMFPPGMIATSDVSRAYSVHKQQVKPKEVAGEIEIIAS
ncbi:hypothetical protein M427DRAFT_50472 [Gonapodya prolifera JEL478]|uniref:Ubinuclein middle domain-containing protein n=1 Tax=Gonapodya prolifera (strain JEL478) TaxID=1344416 RepID=A0A139AZH3_GONPJ|nr:hypothetical protein M427DRAFT_50472 [Gonapodya prolifera JEL478]|eukprot:KXS22110.1 hypothetical protein M427DRAFT_50472 [Gonapodya prolifera JEL478]